MLVQSALIAAAATGVALAQNGDSANGRDLYLYFCAECHGKDGASVGPVAEMLAIDPPILAELSKRNAGIFPLAKVAMQIDGRMPIEAHSYMPIFGPSLDDDQYVAFTLPSGQPMMVSQPHADLLIYLQSIQSRTE